MMQDLENMSFPQSSISEMDYIATGEGFNFSTMNNNNNNNNNNYSFGGGMSMSGSSCASFYPGPSRILIETMTDQSKAVASSRVLHKEAEKRRRERINSHLDRLRSLIPCTSKTDKATLLSKVVQRVVELKRQASDLPPLQNLVIPSEIDEFEVYIHNNNSINTGFVSEDEYICGDNDEDGDEDNCDQVVLKASICCEDRPDLFADFTRVLGSLNLKTVRAEICTLGGRIQGVLLVSGDYNKSQRDECVVFLRDALKGIVQRSGSPEDRLKRRRRVFDHHPANY